MLNWLSLDERSLTPTEHTAWKISALRIILLSGLVLEALIGFHSSWDALALGAYHVVVITAFFFVLIALGVHYSTHRPALSAGLLIFTVYAAAFSIVSFIGIGEVAQLGFIFVYTTPLIGRLFFGNRVALGLMLFNVLPFSLLLWGGPLPTFSAFNITLPGSRDYIHALLFLFFNVCIPLAVFRVLHALDAAARRQRGSHDALARAAAQYREIFENSGGPLLLCDERGAILQANPLARALLALPEDNGEITPGPALFEVLLAPSDHPASPWRADMLITEKTAEFRTPGGKIVTVENIALTAQKNYIVALRDNSDLAEIRAALARSREMEDYLHHHDRLTQLPNRQGLEQHLTELFAGESGQPLAGLVMLRLNSIRQANEKFGIAAGDELLRRFAEALAETLPANCFCARLRSIVFAFVIDHVRTPSDVMRQVERIRQALPKEMDIDGKRLLVQVSAGVALARRDSTAPQDLIKRSEIALDRARRSPDSDQALFAEEDAARILRSVDIEVGLVNALQRQELRLAFQPKVTPAGVIAGLEALVRWHSPTLGEVSPAEFVPIAEACGLIPSITNQVLAMACGQIRQWLDDHGKCPPVAVNLSAIDIVRHDLLQLIDATCSRHRIPPALLEFEITETGLIGNEALAIHHLTELKRQGFSIAIDDFGTGYSSLAKLSRFPARSIKIDRSFIARIGSSAKSELIIKAIISLADFLSCSTVAEGVETEEQERFLQSVGCAYFQGYRYYRPLPPAEVAAILFPAAQKKAALTAAS